jgi:5-methyltetrahydrofolate--homocysteine methyltransferase
LGPRNLGEVPLEQLLPFIDWSPFFMTWELKGKYPTIFKDEHVGAQARQLFDDAQQLLKRIVAEKLLQARGIFGFWPANSVGDDIVLFTDESRREELARLHTLRQQWQRKGTTNYYALADFVAPLSSGRADYVGAFAVTAGHGTDELVKHFGADHDDYNSIMSKALADRLAEAFAEMLHQQARREWGYGRGEELTNDDLIREEYRGIRPAPGYPACPDHTEKQTIWRLLDVERETGIQLTDSCAMWPAAAVSGLYFSHPQSRYFAVDLMTRDQVEDYARRKGIPLADAERWLSPNLGYEPG